MFTIGEDDDAGALTGRSSMVRESFFDGCIELFLSNETASDLTPGSLGRRAAISKLPTMTPGPELIDLLNRLEAAATAEGTASSNKPDAALPVDQRPASELVEIVAAWDRVTSWAGAQTAARAAALSRTAEMNPMWPRTSGNVANECVATEELAMRLGCTRMAAANLIDLGVQLDGPLAATGKALASGAIDLAKAKVLKQRLDWLPEPVVCAVQDMVLPGASTRTTTQLAKDIEKALLEVDPAAAETRRQEAGKDRRVCRPKALGDGMAGFWAIIPAVQAVRIDATLDASARSLRASGDARTLDQLRADLFTHTLLHNEPLHHTPSAEPGQQEPATSPASPQQTGDTEAGGETASGNTQTARKASRVSSRTIINVTIPYTALLGLDEATGELSGFGPISAELARELAADATWRRVLTDPVTEQVLNVDRTRYRPPTALAEHIRIRDQVCARPGCSAQAASCDLDHTIEFTRHNGTTSHTNLGPLCPRDHAIKTDGGFTLTQPAPGVFHWTTPTGHQYRTWPGQDGRYEILHPRSHSPANQPPGSA